MASPYSTGGGGLHLEARVVAYCATAVLCEASVRGLPGEFATAVKTQRAAFEDPLDDVIVAGVRQDGRVTELHLQIKNKLTFTEDNKEWADALKRAWDTFAKDSFDPVAQRIGVGIGTYNARVDQHYQSVLNWASCSTDGRHFIERVEKGDYSHRDKQSFVTTVRKVLAAHAGRNLTDDEMWRFLAVFVIVHFDFQSTESSRDEANAVDRLRGLLSPEHRSQAVGIWDHLVAKAGELIPAGGGATRATLVELLTREGLSIGTAPSFWKDLAAIHRESDRALSDIKSHIHGLRLHREEPYQEARAAMAEGRFIQIDGEPGTGKSALLKDLAEESRRNGPIFVLKDARIHPRGWSAHAHVLGVSDDLAALLREFACAGEPILFVDGIDKIVDPAIQLTVNDVLKTIAFSDNLGEWRVVVTVREQNLRHLETWLDPDALKKLPLKTIGVTPLSDEDLVIVASEFPRLRPLLHQPGNTEVILRRPFFLDAILTLAGREGTATLPATEVEILKLWWELGGTDRADFSPAQHRRNLLIELAEHIAGWPNSPIPIRDVTPELLGELKSAGIVRDKELGHSVVFTHDIYEEWALCQLLRSYQSDVAAFLKKTREPDILLRPMQLLGTYALETGASADAWKALYDNTGDSALRPVWQRAILTSCLQSTRTTQLLHGITDYLLENGSQRLKKMLVAVSTVEVVPNPLFLDEKLVPDLDPADRARFAHQLALPKGLTWVRFLDWLVPQVPKLPHALILDVLPIFTTWQNSFAGRKVRHCRAIGQLSHKWLLEIEQAHHPKTFSERREPFAGALKGHDVEKTIRSLFLSSAGDAPELVAEYLRAKAADTEHSHRLRGEILNNSGALFRYLPTDLVDFFLAAFLEMPVDEVERFGGRSHLVVDELGIADSHQFYPASPVQPPFLGLLNFNEAEGLRLVRALSNHAVSIWRWFSENANPLGPAVPVPITLTFPWGAQTFWGDRQVYLWFRGTWGNNAVKSALMALEQWALAQLDVGAPFEEVFRKVIEGNDSVAVLGIGVSLCLASSGRSLPCALPLVTCPHLWHWDITRAVQDMGLNPNVMGDWYRHKTQLNAVRALNSRLHRQQDIRGLVPYFVFSDVPELREKYTQGIRAFPDQLPFEYEHEKTRNEYSVTLREKMTLYSEQGDPAYWKTAPAPDGQHVQLWNEPPSLNREEYQIQQRENARISDFLSVVLWAQKTLEGDRIEERMSITDALAKARQWDAPDLFDSPRAYESEQCAGAVAGTAFVTARHSTDEEWTEELGDWCMDVFDRARAASEKSGNSIFRGSILSMHPCVFAVYGYAAALARGYRVAHCQDALLRLAVDALEGVQIAVFKSAKYYALRLPSYYWVLVDLAVRQCIVPKDAIPDYHSRSWSRAESDFKQALIQRAQAFIRSGTSPELPVIPIPWVKSTAAANRQSGSTKGYFRNDAVFVYHVAGKLIFESYLEPILSDSGRRTQFLKMVDELLQWTIQEIVPPFADSRRDYRGQTPFEWVFGMSFWCGKLCAHLTATEAKKTLLARIFAQDAETSLLIMQSLMRAFMLKAFVTTQEIRDDAIRLWSEITDWLLASPEYNRDDEHLGNELTSCAFATLFCAAPDFSPLICVIDPGWPHLLKFAAIVERAIREFGLNNTLYAAVTTFLKKGGFDLLPEPALGWLQDIVQAKKGDQAFWQANGEDTVGLLRQLIEQKSSLLSPEHHNAVKLMADILIDNGVRGAGFLHQELLRVERGPR